MTLPVKFRLEPPHDQCNNYSVRLFVDFIGIPDVYKDIIIFIIEKKGEEKQIIDSNGYKIHTENLSSEIQWTVTLETVSLLDIIKKLSDVVNYLSDLERAKIVLNASSDAQKAKLKKKILEWDGKIISALLKKKIGLLNGIECSVLFNDCPTHDSKNLSIEENSNVLAITFNNLNTVFNNEKECQSYLLHCHLLLVGVKDKSPLKFEVLNNNKVVAKFTGSEMNLYKELSIDLPGKEVISYQFGLKHGEIRLTEDINDFFKSFSSNQDTLNINCRIDNNFPLPVNNKKLFIGKYNNGFWAIPDDLVNETLVFIKESDTPHQTWRVNSKIASQDAQQEPKDLNLFAKIQKKYFENEKGDKQVVLELTTGFFGQGLTSEKVGVPKKYIVLIGEGIKINLNFLYSSPATLVIDQGTSASCVYIYENQIKSEFINLQDRGESVSTQNSNDLLLEEDSRLLPTYFLKKTVNGTCLYQTVLDRDTIARSSGELLPNIKLLMQRETIFLNKIPFYTKDIIKQVMEHWLLNALDTVIDEFGHKTFNKIIFTVPNNYSNNQLHIYRAVSSSIIKKLVKNEMVSGRLSFHQDYKPEIYSESESVLMGYLNQFSKKYPEEKFNKSIVIIDVGAGTTDLTYARVDKIGGSWEVSITANTCFPAGSRFYNYLLAEALCSLIDIDLPSKFITPNEGKPRTQDKITLQTNIFMAVEKLKVLYANENLDEILINEIKILNKKTSNSTDEFTSEKLETTSFSSAIANGDLKEQIWTATAFQIENLLNITGHDKKDKLQIVVSGRGSLFKLARNILDKYALDHNFSIDFITHSDNKESDNKSKYCVAEGAPLLSALREKKIKINHNITLPYIYVCKQEKQGYFHPVRKLTLGTNNLSSEFGYYSIVVSYEYIDDVQNKDYLRTFFIEEYHDIGDCFDLSITLEEDLEGAYLIKIEHSEAMETYKVGEHVSKNRFFDKALYQQTIWPSIERYE